jgi:hypothetical protein
MAATPSPLEVVACFVRMRPSAELHHRPLRSPSRASTLGPCTPPWIPC